MIAIQFCTTPKGDLPHQSFIFRNPEPLVTEMKNVDCSRLGTTLHQDFQRYKKATKMLYFQKDLIATAACMNIVTMDKKGCGKLTSNDT